MFPKKGKKSATSGLSGSHKENKLQADLGGETTVIERWDGKMEDEEQADEPESNKTQKRRAKPTAQRGHRRAPESASKR